MGNKKKKQAKKPVKKSSSGLPSGFFPILALIIFLGVVAGVAAAFLTRGGGGEEASGSGSGNGVKLPSYVNDPTAPKGTAIAYQFAVDNPELLEPIPCYCGCGEIDGHKNNLDCFIKSPVGAKVEFDDHAVGWDIWVEIALDVRQWSQEGTGIKEIRDRIDDKYSKLGYTPTPTPPVEE